MPAVGTALIIDKDAYNAGGPPDDATLAFAGDLLASLGALHAALDDDLAGLSLTPCTVVGDGTGTCAAQGLPLIVPDTLKIDTTGVAGFPNGRGLEDSVIDITLAVILLDLGVHSVSLLADLPLGPAGNDVAFAADFPFLAPAH
jgi:hypothetical protein